MGSGTSDDDMAKPSRGARFFFDDHLGPNTDVRFRSPGPLRTRHRLALHVAHFRGLNDDLPSIDGVGRSEAHRCPSCTRAPSSLRTLAAAASRSASPSQATRISDELAKGSFNEADLLRAHRLPPQAPVPPAETDFPVEVIEHGGLGNSDRPSRAGGGGPWILLRGDDPTRLRSASTMRVASGLSNGESSPSRLD